MPLPVKTYNEFITDQANAIQASAPQIEFPEGSLNLAEIEANAGVSLWLQAQTLQLLDISRASTCKENDDLNSWMMQFNFPRLSAQKSSGLVTFSRLTPTQQAVVPVAAQVATTSPTSIFFEVYADPSNPNYNPFLGGYVLGVDVSSVDVPVRAKNGGVDGNVSSHTIDTIIGTIVGVDNVDNSAAFDNGKDEESNEDYFSRWLLYFNGLEKGTYPAVEYAVLSTIGIKKYNIVQNKNPDGSSNPGYFYVVIDPPDLVNAVLAAVTPVAPLAILFDVVEPATSLAVAISATVKIASGYDTGIVQTAIVDALTNYINSIPFGGTIFYTKIGQIIYDSSIAVLSASALLLNGATADLTVNANQEFSPGAITITIS